VKGRERRDGLSLAEIDSVGGVGKTIAFHFAGSTSRGHHFCFCPRLHHALGIWYLPMNSSTESCGVFVSHMLHITLPAGR
jgi:hypothetical protein